MAACDALVGGEASAGMEQVAAVSEQLEQQVFLEDWQPAAMDKATARTASQENRSGEFFIRSIL
ncbi:MAG: hypothetical protein ACREDQ_04255 [Limisphaerales bacterium]